MSKKFQRKIEDFICENCGTLVKGNGYTNHCPNCLYSKDVDINPGDRKSSCGGLMKPISIEVKKDHCVIMHECIKCGKKRPNKSGDDDNFETILKIMKSQI